MEARSLLKSIENNRAQATRGAESCASSFSVTPNTRLTPFMTQSGATGTATGSSTIGDNNEMSMDVMDLELPDDSGMMTDSLHTPLE